MLSGTAGHGHLRLQPQDQDQQGSSPSQSYQEASQQDKVDPVLHSDGVPDRLHRVGGDDVVLHLGLPGQGGGEEHVLQRGQHHQLLRLFICQFDVSYCPKMCAENKHLEFYENNKCIFYLIKY